MAALLAVIGLTGGALATSGCSAVDDSQGLESGGNKIGWHGVMEPGDVFTDGMQQLHLLGDEPVEIVDVQASTDGDLEFLGAMIAGPRRGVNIQAEPGFPPAIPASRDLVPARGAVLQPPPQEMSEAGYALYLGYEVGHDYRSVRHDVTVTYRVGGRERKVVYKYAMAICTSGADRYDCEPPFTS